MSGRGEQHHERVSTFLVASDKAQASQNEIRMALESSDDQAKVLAMQKAIAALLNGEQLPQLFITIVRYVLPSENHLVQKLLLLYLVRIFYAMCSVLTLSILDFC
jgi:coatomer subunit beta